MKREFDLQVCWSAFPLHPEIPEEGMTLEQLFAGRFIDLDQVMARLKEAARAAGLPFGERRMTYNSRLAQELGKWAEEKGRGTAFHQATFRAYFVDGRNIGKTDILVALAQSTGLPPDEAQMVLRDRTYREAVDADWARAREIGIQAVPTLVLGRNVLVGAQPYEQMSRFIEAAE